MKFTSFDSVVRQICREMDDPTAKKYLRVATTLKTVLDQLDLHAFPQIKSTFIEINDNYTLDLPADVAMVTKVGTLNSRDNITVLGLDTGLVAPADTSACTCSTTADETPTAESTCSLCTFHGYLFKGGNVGEVYGRREPQFTNGRWRPDYGNNRIILSSTGTSIVAGNRLLVEYKQDMDSDNRMMQIPKDAFAMLMYRTFMIMDAYSNPGKTQIYARNFKIEYDTFKQKNSPVSAKDIIAAIRGSAMSAIKR